MEPLTSAVGRAGGKVILLGEHAVVHGTPSLAVGLPDRMRVTAVREAGAVSLEVPAWGLRARVDGDGDHDRALRSLVMALGMEGTGLRLVGEPGIPPRAGLGSSASVAAASARALCAISGIRPMPELIFDAVQASEKVYHGNPSGLDASVVIHGGVIRFSRRAGVHRVEAPPPPLVVIHSGQAGDTGMTVARFAQKLESDPARGGRRLEQIAALVEEGIDAIKVWDLPTIGAVMNENQGHLRWFGVSTDALDHICDLALGAGALGAKLTGGGGGGCAVALVTPELRDAVVAAAAAAGYSVVPT